VLQAKMQSGVTYWPTLYIVARAINNIGKFFFQRNRRIL